MWFPGPGCPKMPAGPDRLKGRRCVGDVRILSLNFKLQELNGSDFNGSTLKVQAGKPKRCANPALKVLRKPSCCLPPRGAAAKGKQATSEVDQDACTSSIAKPSFCKVSGSERTGTSSQHSAKWRAATASDRALAASIVVTASHDPRSAITKEKLRQWIEERGGNSACLSQWPPFQERLPGGCGIEARCRRLHPGNVFLDVPGRSPGGGHRSLYHFLSKGQRVQEA